MTIGHTIHTIFFHPKYIRKDLLVSTRILHALARTLRTHLRVLGRVVHQQLADGLAQELPSLLQEAGEGGT